LLCDRKFIVMTFLGQKFQLFEEQRQKKSGLDGQAHDLHNQILYLDNSMSQMMQLQQGKREEAEKEKEDLKAERKGLLDKA